MNTTPDVSMGEMSRGQRGVVDDDKRLAEITEVVVAIARKEFDKRATVGDGSHLLDGLAAGLNMLSEEIGQRDAREKEYQHHLLQNERLIAVGQLAAGVAHELNNPAAFVLTNLSALSQSLLRLEALARGGASSEALVAAVQSARNLTRDNINGVERVVAIIRELRNFARLEPEQVEVVSLGNVIADACTLVRAELSYRAALRVDVDALLRVRGDRTKLTQVFTNLLLNAAHAIPEGSASSNEVWIRAVPRGDSVAVEVRDTGSGMTPEAQARMFEPFFTTKPRDRGTGLGLAISADIVRHHGGSLTLAETSPRGTTFEVLLPLAGGAESARAKTPTPAPVQLRRRARILIIDDEQMLLEAYRRFFAGDYDVTTEVGGTRAIERISQDDAWDVVMCDVMMPEVDGVEVFEWVSANRPALLERMVFCSGGAFTPRSIAFTERHGRRVLEKPVPLEELRATFDAIAAGGHA